GSENGDERISPVDLNDDISTHSMGTITITDHRISRACEIAANLRSLLTATRVSFRSLAGSRSLAGLSAAMTLTRHLPWLRHAELWTQALASCCRPRRRP